jgi:hypothetical protein
LVCFSLPSCAFIAVEVEGALPSSELNRHRPGDTWMIGGKPHDPDDPGVWPWKPDPNYKRDRRTGRHRRGELPDPLPACIDMRTASPQASSRPGSPHAQTDVKILGRSGHPVAARNTTRDARPTPWKPSPSPDHQVGPGCAVPTQSASSLAVAEAAEHRMAELAWSRFLRFSEPLARAHTARRAPGRIPKALRTVARWCAGIFSVYPNGWAR